ncbi:MAG: hypothetical protein JSR24_01965 [Proteobacteria bacterium]|nr:hypothetical protein [Pseudomonadota bacterium]
MPRIRIIDPHFPRTPSLSRISRARLFFILLWTVADDSGRLRLDHERLIEQLYPFDPDAPSLLPVWLGELEAARCIELYRVDDVEYLRVRKWRELQSIDRPTPSRLPRSPSETARETREPREESPPTQTARAPKAVPREDAFSGEGEVALPGTPGEFPPERVLAILEIALRKSLATDTQTATARYIELAGRKAGLWSGNGAPVGRRPETPSLVP